MFLQTAQGIFPSLLAFPTSSLLIIISVSLAFNLNLLTPVIVSKFLIQSKFNLSFWNLFLQPFKKMRKFLTLCLENMKSFKHFHWIRGFKDNGNLVFNIYFGKRLSLVFQGSKLADLYHSPYKMFFMMLGRSRCKCTNYKSWQ